MKLVSVSEMQCIEGEANASGLTYEMMMENAGIGLGKIVDNLYSQNVHKNVLGLVGSGNNGGDTLVALDYLTKNGWKTTACIIGKRSQFDPLEIRFKNAGGNVYRIEHDEDFLHLRSLLNAHNLILDGILGTGFKLPLRGSISELLVFIRQTLASMPVKINIVAVDCPSGIDCDTGKASEYCLPADYTVTMAAAKFGLVKFPAAKFVGKLILLDISLGELSKQFNGIKRFIVTKEWVGVKIPERSPESHKGTYGTALIIAGSQNYPGAALLSGKAAYLAGVGLVTMATPKSIFPSLVGQFPEATWLPLPDKNGYIKDKSISTLKGNIDRVSCILIGPGFGVNTSTRQFLNKFLSEDNLKNFDKKPIGLVLDADGLKLLSKLSKWKDRLLNNSILTPHPGEMAIMSGLSVSEIQDNRLDVAERFALEWGHILVLKGAFTIVASPKGLTAIIPVASAALAKAGTGDVLAGLITGFRSQGMDAFDAAVVGAYIHAQAGLYAAEVKNSNSVVLAGDILTGIASYMGGFDQLKKYIALT